MQKLSNAQQKKLADESWKIFHKNINSNNSNFYKDIAENMTSIWCKNNGINDKQFDTAFKKIAKKHPNIDENNLYDMVEKAFSSQQEMIQKIQIDLVKQYRW